MSAGSESQPVVVYIDDDAGARAAFERAFRAEHHIVAMPTSALAHLDLRRAGVIAFDAQALGSLGEQAFALYPHAMRVVLAKPWQQDDVSQLLRTACAAWVRSTAHARSLAHDLRTPLMSLLADAEHLSILAEKAPDLREVATVANDMQRAVRLVQELLERLEI